MSMTPDEAIDPQGDATEAVQIESPLPPSPPPPMDSNDKAETISDQVRKARDSIPVGDHGIEPLRYEQQVTIAKDYSRAYLMLPQHLHNNVAVLVALVGIAARFKIDPMMLASMTYVSPGTNKLAFQSQAFGAILNASGLLLGRLRYEFHGEAGDITCTVSGRFKDDPDHWHSATTPPLKLLHPGYSKKEGKQGMVAGSPLWDKDGEQQLGYFGQRRWIRRHCPECIMGLYSAEEIAELDSYRAGQSGAIPLTADRLGQLDTGEGWRDGAHVDLDLASIAPEQPEFEREPELEPELPLRRPPPQKPVQRKPTGQRKVAPIAVKTRQARPARPPVAKPRGHPPTSAVVKAAVKRAEQPPPRRVAPMPRWLDYVTETEAWIKKLSADEAPQAEGRWEGERAERDKAQVPIGERSRLRALLDRKLAQLGPKT